MGEMQLGLGQKLNSFFYILISSGLGGGLVVDGAYLRGADGRSGELGFMLAPRAAAAASRSSSWSRYRAWPSI